MEDKIALSKSNGWVNMDGLTGYYPFSAANYLVCTKKYEFFQVCWQGYVLKTINKNGE